MSNIPQPTRYIFMLFVFFGFCFVANAQRAGSVNIKEILVNGESVPANSYDDIVLSQADTILFRYDYKRTAGNPFLFNLSLIKDQDTAARTAGLKEVSYSALSDGDYIFQVNAFDLQGGWSTDFTIIEFRVNNSEAALRAEIKMLQNTKTTSDSTIVALNSQIADKQSQDVLFRYGAIAGGAIALVFIILFIIAQTKNRALQKIATKLEDSMSTLKEHDKNEEEHIKQLKSNIDAINKRIENITELRESIDTDVAQVQGKASDLTGLRKQKNDIFGDVLKGISNPTNAIKSLIELLRNYDFNAKDMHDIVNNIVEATSKIIENADAIQRLSEISSNDMQVSLESYDMEQLINAVVKKNSAEAKQKNINIVVNISNDVHSVHIDQQKISIVIHNLLHNAIKFTNENGKVNINCYIRDEKLLVEVIDTGVGIDQTTLKQMYTNLGSSSADYDIMDVGGAVGLFTVKKYVEAHNGRVTVSSALNQGSKFAFHIPIV